MSDDAKQVTLIIDGREVQASEGEMLHDAAKQGDVEIPVFCYEPKLGAPVGACRMCLVEIEGIPKLQTSCSTPVRDGMVVHTRTDQVREAQNAVVEFLLVNHPLDCPVCDKGGECPLQDITMGWGAGRSRMIDQKRHFEKPIELSPLVAIDRERCILCYRCVRFSQEVAEDEQLQLLERGDRTFVGTFDERPYVAPFHGNITDLCPVGALTSYTYRFRARPWDIEQAGSVCTLCPSQCNLSFTIRDEQVKRVVARDNPEVDDGWLCDRGRYGFEMFTAKERVTEPRLKGVGVTEWRTALEKVAAGLRAAGKGKVAAIVGDASNEEGYLIQRILREALESGIVESRASFGTDRSTRIELEQPNVAARVRDIDGADAILLLGADPLNQSPILDLRIRKAIRRNGAKLLVATDRPTSLDGGAAAVARYVPGTAANLLADLTACIADEQPENHSGADPADVKAFAETLSAAGNVVVIWGESIAWNIEGGRRLCDLAAALGMAEKVGSGLLEVPAFANARGLREVGCLPDAGPGISALSPAAMHFSDWQTLTVPRGIESGEIEALILFGVDPIRDFPDSAAWRTALTAVNHLVVFSIFENPTTAMADVVLPLETYAEKDGTVTHPDGRLQRVRPSAPRPGDIRPNWGVLAELSLLLGHDTGIDSQPSAFAAVTGAVPFYDGITDAEIGGRGVRWQDRQAASAFPQPPKAQQREPIAEGGSEAGRGTVNWSEFESEGRSGDLEIYTYRDLWTGPITELNPPLRFLEPEQHLEISLEDAERLSLSSGDEVEVTQNGTSLRARVRVKERMRGGYGFMLAGTSLENANQLIDPLGSPLVKVKKVSR